MLISATMVYEISQVPLLLVEQALEASIPAQEVALAGSSPSQ